MDLRNFNGIEFRSFYFGDLWNVCMKIFLRSGKCILWGSGKVLPNQEPSMRLKILTYVSYMQCYIKN